MPDELSPYWYSRFVFERGLSLIYLIAFIAVVNQFIPLLGERGLLPVPRFVEAVPFRTVLPRRSRSLAPVSASPFTKRRRRLAAGAALVRLRCLASCTTCAPRSIRWGRRRRSFAAFRFTITG